MSLYLRGVVHWEDIAVDCRVYLSIHIFSIRFKHCTLPGTTVFCALCDGDSGVSSSPFNSSHSYLWMNDNGAIMRPNFFSLYVIVRSKFHKIKVL